MCVVVVVGVWVSVCGGGKVCSRPVFEARTSY